MLLAELLKGLAEGGEAAVDPHVDVEEGGGPSFFPAGRALVRARVPLLAGLKSPPPNYPDVYLNKVFIWKKSINQSEIELRNVQVYMGTRK